MSAFATSQEKGSGHRAALGVVRLLSLAATPTFALMAVLSAVQESGAAGVLCSMQHPSPLTGMAAMYALMSAFHLSPWLRLIAKWRSAANRDPSARRAEPPISVC
jgi:hypothetical protein